MGMATTRVGLVVGSFAASVVLSLALAGMFSGASPGVGAPGAARIAAPTGSEASPRATSLDEMARPPTCGKSLIAPVPLDGLTQNGTTSIPGAMGGGAQFVLWPFNAPHGGGPEGHEIGHIGIDFASDTVYEVVAPADGIVQDATSDGWRGSGFTIVHDCGVVSRFGHAAPLAGIGNGTRVAQGQPVGRAIPEPWQCQHLGNYTWFPCDGAAAVHWDTRASSEDWYQCPLVWLNPLDEARIGWDSRDPAQAGTLIALTKNADVVRGDYPLTCNPEPHEGAMTPGRDLPVQTGPYYGS